MSMSTAVYMTSSLHNILVTEILEQGPMNVERFMAQALAHPEHGYYMKQDPFGVDGDFTTAPEISQMFGELVGAWVADVWVQMGCPSSFTFLECGPGRGTLTADVMRVTKAVPGFHSAVHIHLLETSPVLKAKQHETLSAYKPVWHESLDAVPDRGPVIIIANEFLDALPIRQFQKIGKGWQERMVDYNQTEGFRFVSVSSDLDISDKAPIAGSGDVFEFSPVRTEMFQKLCEIVKANTGGALFIDYGHLKSGLGETLQALYKHQYTDVFDHIGDADMTAHVDFDSLVQTAKALDIYVSDVIEQGSFLKNLGILYRARALMSKADEMQKKDITAALHRLIDSDQMGSLFKVLGFHYGYPFTLPGF